MSDRRSRAGTAPLPTRPSTPSTAAADTTTRWVMLAVATLGFAVNFWAWALLSARSAPCSRTASG